MERNKKKKKSQKSKKNETFIWASCPKNMTKRV
jgi:hypothetical protein